MSIFDLLKPSTAATPSKGILGDPQSQMMLGASLLSAGEPSLTPKSGFEGIPQTMALMQRQQMLKQEQEQKAAERDRMMQQRQAQMDAVSKLGIDPNLPSGIQSAMFSAQNKSEKLPTSVQEFLYGQQNPDFYDHQRRMAEAKSTKINNNMNVDQGKNAGFADRVANSNKILESVETEGTSLWNENASDIPVIGNFLTGDNYKVYDQARRDFVNAALRRESGAVISPQEFANAEKQYFPQPGDTKEVIAQKRANRDLVLKSMVRQAGPGYEAPSMPGQAGGKAIKDMSDAELEAIVNGQ
ncbi:hypothetical protein AB1P65_09540 [Roseibium alexandrii]